MQNEKLNLEYAPETLTVSRTSYPNGQTIDYGKQGRPRYNLLPSNHPLVLAEKSMRVQNVKRKPRTLIEEAGVIIQLTSEKMRRVKG